MFFVSSLAFWPFLVVWHSTINVEKGYFIILCELAMAITQAQWSIWGQWVFLPIYCDIDINPIPISAHGQIIPNDKSLTILHLEVFRQAFYSIHIESILFNIM